MDFLNKKKVEFLNQVSEINNKIDRNPHVLEPDMREIMSSYITLAEISSRLISDKVRDNSYKSIINTYSLIMKQDGIFKSCYNRMREIVIKKKISSSKEFTKPSFFDMEETINILDLLDKMIRLGCYPNPVSGSIREFKKSLVCDTVAVAYEIWKNKEVDDTYQYEDFCTYNKLEDLYYSYKGALKISDYNRAGVICDMNGCEVFNTDNSEDLLMRCIDRYRSYIQDNYKYYETSDLRARQR